MDTWGWLADLPGPLIVHDAQKVCVRSCGIDDTLGSDFKLLTCMRRYLYVIYTREHCINPMRIFILNIHQRAPHDSNYEDIYMQYTSKALHNERDFPYVIYTNGHCINRMRIFIQNIHQRAHQDLPENLSRTLAPDTTSLPSELVDLSREMTSVWLATVAPILAAVRAMAVHILASSCCPATSSTSPVPQCTPYCC